MEITMPTGIGRDELQTLTGRGAQLVEVLLGAGFGPVPGDNLSLTRDGDNVRLSMWLR
jgi:hypothetical protein